MAIAGIITDLKRRKSKKGQWWASFQLEDLQGVMDVLVFPKAYESAQHLLEDDRPVLVAGRLETEEERLRVLADTVSPLEGLRERHADAVQIRLEAGELDEDLVDRLRRAVEGHRGDKTLYLEVVRAGGYRLVARAETGLRVSPSLSLTRALEEVVGPGRVHYRARAAH